MTIREHINISDDRLMNGLLPVVRIMSEINSSNDSEVALDFSDTKFVSPVFILSLIVFATRCGKKISIIGANKYLETIGFTDGGIAPDKLRGSAFLAIMEGYSNKTYIPIVSFPANTNTDEKETISSIVEDIIIRQLHIEHNVATGIKYLMISGNSMYMKNRDIDNFYSFPRNIRLDGTVVALRIPFQSPNFNYVNYIE